MIKNNEKIKGTQLLQRTFQIIELLSKNPKGLILSDVSHKTNLPISTVYRILSFLNQNDYIRNDKNTGCYSIGPKFALYSSIFLHGFDFIKEIRPGLEEINKEYDETIHLSILNSTRTKVVYIDKIESSHAVRMFSVVGQTVPIHCTALGKSLFATLSDQEIGEILNHYNLEKFTETTITSKEEFLEEIEKVRALGYAVDYREHEENIICFGKAFHNSINNNFLSISISIPDYRIEEEKINNIIKSLNQTAAWCESKLKIDSSANY